MSDHTADEAGYGMDASEADPSQNGKHVEQAVGDPGYRTGRPRATVPSTVTVFASKGPLMVLDLPATLRLVSHELRSPLGVIQGYLRMLGDGRIEDNMRPRVVAQMQRAAARLATIGHQASELSHWISDAPRGHQDVSIGDLLEEIGARSTQAIRIAGLTTPEYAGVSVRTPDMAALAVAGAALVEVVVRKSGATATLAAAPAAEPGDLDLWVAPATVTVDRSLIRRAQDRGPVDLEEGGLGLSLLIAAAVVDAHGGQLWQSTSQLVYGMTVRRGAQA